MMKLFTSNLLIFISIAAIDSWGQGIIIDHTCLNLEQIPQEIIEEVKQNTKWHYAHTSHGESLVCGLDLLEAQNSLYDYEVEYGSLPTAENALCIMDGQEVFGYITPELYYLTETGMYLTMEALNNNPQVNVSAFCWCTQMDEFPTEYVQVYLDSMSALESYFPDVDFIYFTGNSQESGEMGYNRHVNNQFIRQYCIDNNKVLFDFGDLDCWYNGEMNYYLYNNDTVPIEHSAYFGNDCGHANSLSNLVKAKAIWWLMARLQGWNPTGIPADIKVFLEGPYGMGYMESHLNTMGLLPANQPYSLAPWNYAGNESVNIFPGNIVDWILLEFRVAEDIQSALTAPITSREAVMLLTDGSVVSADGMQPRVLGPTNQNLFVKIIHRNHVDIFSAYPLSYNGEKYTYQFQLAGNMAYQNRQKQLSPGIWGMISGDSDGSGVVDEFDMDPGWILSAGTQQYDPADLNLDSQCDNLDKNQFWFPNLGAGNSVSY